MTDASSASPIIAIIPARGGSKGIPGKNLKPVAGLPLLAHSIRQALASSCVHTCLVSTDDEQIATAAREHGAQVIHRPPELSGDMASSESALVHALAAWVAEGGPEPELVVFLQCTSPVRGHDDIDVAVATLRSEAADSLLSVSPFHRFIWQQSDEGAASVNYDFRNRQRRQDLPARFVENGSIYVFKPWVLRDTGNRLGGRVALHVMSERASFEIDTEFDLELIDHILRSEPGVP